MIHALSPIATVIGFVVIGIVAIIAVLYLGLFIFSLVMGKDHVMGGDNMGDFPMF